MQNIIKPQVMDTFIAMFTHDLKTPINSGIFALEMLLKDNTLSLNENQKEILNDVLNANRFMKNLTENLLCKYKAESGNLIINKEYCSIKSLVLDCIDDTKYLIAEKYQTVVFNASKKDIFANVDKIELTRVINNLIVNASNYSQKYSKIVITIKALNNKIYFEIQDNGCGINMCELDRVFEEYVRLANEQKTAGTGLGLYITKLIVDAHGGSVKIKSKLGEGTKISIILPC